MKIIKIKKHFNDTYTLEISNKPKEYFTNNRSMSDRVDELKQQGYIVTNDQLL